MKFLKFTKLLAKLSTLYLVYALVTRTKIDVMIFALLIIIITGAKTNMKIRLLEVASVTNLKLKDYIKLLLLIIPYSAVLSLFINMIANLFGLMSSPFRTLTSFFKEYSEHYYISTLAEPARYLTMVLFLVFLVLMLGMYKSLVKAYKF